MSTNYLQHGYIPGPHLRTWEKSVSKPHKGPCPQGAYNENGRTYSINSTSK